MMESTVAEPATLPMVLVRVKATKVVPSRLQSSVVLQMAMKTLIRVC